ncbi:hypothetical protein CN085_19535 [Sinorhizobium meliloti]|uniref:hypothetical protein n=1 Tax=Rhizobium meliloti TaxID=382 RepID=UPI000FD86C9A|nr:hypothetical protein [Sinorhizobium meliloti]RVP13106.1 hypothetical protein CN085_19535 [Sinorhizobium meliloti]
MNKDRKDLVERLRGIYRIPITDGLGPAGGEEPDNPNEFVRTFPSPPIQIEAAAEIDRLRRELEEARKALEPFAKIGGYMRYTPQARSVSVVYMAIEADGINSHGSAKATVADFRNARAALRAGEEGR